MMILKIIKILKILIIQKKKELIFQEEKNKRSLKANT